MLNIMNDISSEVKLAVAYLPTVFFSTSQNSANCSLEEPEAPYGYFLHDIVGHQLKKVNFTYL